MPLKMRGEVCPRRYNFSKVSGYASSPNPTPMNVGRRLWHSSIFAVILSKECWLDLKTPVCRRQWFSQVIETPVEVSKNWKCWGYFIHHCLQRDQEMVIGKKKQKTKFFVACFCSIFVLDRALCTNILNSKFSVTRSMVAYNQKQSSNYQNKLLHVCFAPLLLFSGFITISLYDRCHWQLRRQTLIYTRNVIIQSHKGYMSLGCHVLVRCQIVKYATFTRKLIFDFVASGLKQRNTEKKSTSTQNV